MDDLLIELPQPEIKKQGWPWTESVTSEIYTCKTNWPKISIVTPSYNQEEFLEETIRSVLLQNYPNLEYIIIDGASKDNSIRLIHKYEPWLSYWVSEKDEGQTFAIAKGIEKTTGQLVNWLNSDDMLLPNALFEIAKAWIEQKDKKALYCGGYKIINQESKIRYTRIPDFRQEKILPMEPPIVGYIQSSIFFDKNAWNQIGGIDLSLNYTMDTDLYYKASYIGIPFVLISKSIAAYRRHNDTKTLAGWKESIRFKKRFFSHWLEKVEDRQKHLFKKKVRLNIASYYFNSITESDRLMDRVVKIYMGLKTAPEYVLTPYRLKRIFKLLINGR